MQNERRGLIAPFFFCRKRGYTKPLPGMIWTVGRNNRRIRERVGRGGDLFGQSSILPVATACCRGSALFVPEDFIVYGSQSQAFYIGLDRNE